MMKIKWINKIDPNLIFFGFYMIIVISCSKIVREPKVETGTVSDITTTSARATGDIIDNGDGIPGHGHCWSTKSNPTINDSKTSLGTISRTGSFTSVIQSLQPGMKYYIKAYVKSADNEVYYGGESSFSTISVAIPTLTTTPVTSITSTTVTSGGNVTSDGGAAVTARGVCWSTSANPTVTLSTKTTNGSGTGSFASNITGLTGNTTYHVRAYATNSAGTSYGSDVTFTTPVAIVAPTVTTGTTTATSSTTATSCGNVTSDGGATVTTRGVCWSTNANPTIALSTKTSNGNGTGTFTSSINGLNANTTYHVRAYATNSAGSSYGSDVTFTTPPAITLPTVTTGTTTTTSSTTATSGGNVTSDGGAAVTARGVCWSTSKDPTIANSHSFNGTGTGSFTSYITDLTANTTYHVRAYSTNSQGTNYGNDVIFITLDPNDIIYLYSTTQTSGGSSIPNTLIRIDSRNGEGAIYGPVGLVAEQFSLDVDPKTGSLFGVNPKNTGILEKIDVNSGISTHASTTTQDGSPVQLSGISFNSGGILYGVAGFRTLGVIDQNEGTFSPINQIVGGNSIIVGIDFSPEDILYAILQTESNGNFLITIDAETASIKLSSDLSGDYSVGDIDYLSDGYIYGTNYSWALLRIDPIELNITVVGSNNLGALGGIASF